MKSYFQDLAAYNDWANQTLYGAISELTQDDAFWKGCQTCKNYDVLTRTEQQMCLCTGMLFDPKNKNETKKVKENVFKRLKKIKQNLFLKKDKK